MQTNTEALSFSVNGDTLEINGKQATDYTADELRAVKKALKSKAKHEKQVAKLAEEIKALIGGVTTEGKKVANDMPVYATYVERKICGAIVEHFNNTGKWPYACEIIEALRFCNISQSSIRLYLSQSKRLFKRVTDGCSHVGRYQRNW